MTSPRCNMYIQQILQQLSIDYDKVCMGKIEFPIDISINQQQLLSDALQGSGLEIMKDIKLILVEKIKISIISLVNCGELIDIKNSDYISQQMNYDYTYLSNVFSAFTGTTIEQQIIICKVEKVKELLYNNELNLTEISYKLNYSSLAHLCAQFKKITGTTASTFKKMNGHTHQVTKCE
jgi:AraC-like DNA-binding protein